MLLTFALGSLLLDTVEVPLLKLEEFLLTVCFSLVFSALSYLSQVVLQGALILFPLLSVIAAPLRNNLRVFL